MHFSLLLHTPPTPLSLMQMHPCLLCCCTSHASFFFSLSREKRRKERKERQRREKRNVIFKSEREISKDMIHEPLDSNRDIWLPKRHHFPLVQGLFNLKVVFHSSLEQILTWWYPLLRSILKNILDRAIISSISSKHKMRNQYFIVNFLMALLPLHIH